MPANAAPASLRRPVSRSAAAAPLLLLLQACLERGGGGRSSLRRLQQLGAECVDSQRGQDSPADQPAHQAAEGAQLMGIQQRLQARGRQAAGQHRDWEPL